MKLNSGLLLVALMAAFLSTSAVAEKWVSHGKNSAGEAFLDDDSIRVENRLVLFKVKLFLNESMPIEGLTFHVSVDGFAVNCNARTAAYTDFNYLDDGGKVLSSVVLPRTKWEFSNKIYEQSVSLVGTVCNHPVVTASPIISKLEALTERAYKGEASAQHTLGLMFFNGKDVPKDVSKAIDLLQKAAAQNHVEAQVSLATIYSLGDGVPKDEIKAIEWGLKAAAQGDADGQLMVGWSYMRGKDFVRAYAWLNLAAAQGIEIAIKTRDHIGKKLTANQRAEGQRLASSWKKGDTFQIPGNSPVAQTPATSTTENSASPKLVSSGSGFVVSSSGYLLTNHHVTNGCSNLKIRDSSKIEHDVTVVATDARNDLALLQTIMPVASPAATFRANGSVESGENVVALGYPLAGVLASEVNVSFGYVSATAGLADDTSKLQISAPVQPGNSGGPLLDQSGNLIGVVVAKLDAIKIAKAIGDIPQNINFAVKGEVAQVFLNAHKVKFKTAATTKKLENTDIASRGRAFTVLVECFK